MHVRQITTSQNAGTRDEIKVVDAAHLSVSHTAITHTCTYVGYACNGLQDIGVLDLHVAVEICGTLKLQLLLQMLLLRHDLGCRNSDYVHLIAHSVNTHTAHNIRHFHVKGQ